MPDQAPPDGKLADLSKDGSPVASRVANPQHALRICKQFVTDDRERSLRRIKVQGAFNGNAQKSAADMQAAGRSADSNLNFKRHRGQIMNAWTPFFDLVCEVPVCIDGDLEFGDPAQDMELMRGFAEYFHDLLFDHTRGFDDMSQLCDLQMLLHGPGVLAWEDEWDYRAKAILAGNFYVPSQTNISLDNCEMAMIYTPKSAGQLWRCISGPTHPGWDIEAVKQVIMSSALAGSEMRQWDWARWEQAFKNGDLFISQTQTKIIPLYTLFVEEMDGTISQKVIPTATANLAFLFDSPSRYESWDQCLCIFPYDIGADGTYHSMKGLGTDIYPFCALLNKIDNSIADLVVSGIKPMWQPTTNAKMETFKMAKWGGGNFVPNGISQLQGDISKGIAPGMEVSQYFGQTMASNTAAASQNEFAPPTVEETAKSAMIRASERAKLTKGLHNRYMRGKDRQYAEMWRRAVNPDLRAHHPGSREALKFQARCYKLCDKLGVPHGALQAVTNIHANRSLGLGSAAMRIEIVNQLMANIDRFDEIGQNEIKRAFVAVMTSYHSVDAIVPSLTTGRDATNDEALAAQEDNGFSLLGQEAEAKVVPGQNHVLHLGVHVPSMEKDQQECEQGMQDPRECFKRLEGKGPHAHLHLAALASNPTRKREFKEFDARLKALHVFQDLLEKTIAEQDAAQPQAPPPGQPDPALVKVQHDAALKQQKQTVTLTLKQQKQEFDMAMQQQSAEFDRRLKDLEAASEMQRKTAAHQVDTSIALSAARADAKKTNGTKE